MTVRASHTADPVRTRSNVRIVAFMLFAVAATLLIASTAYAAPKSKITVPEIAKPDTSNSTTFEEAQAVLDAATPRLRKKLEAFLTQMDAIDRETEISAEEYNAAQDRLSNIDIDIKQREKDLEALAKAYALQSKRLNDRAVSLYREGNMSMLSILLNAESFGDFVARLKYVSELNALDGDLLNRIARERNQMQSAIVQLQKDRVQAVSLEFELKARKIEVTERNDARRKKLRAQNSDLTALLEATQAAENSQEQVLADTIQNGTAPDIALAPGSPVETAMAYRGIPYLWGGETKSGMDCSGLVLFVFAQHGVSLPHYSGAQFLLGEPVEGSLQPNDVVFFGSPVHHVGIYIGGGYFIHAPRTGDVIKISALSGRNDLVGARRFDWQPRTKPIR